MKRIYLSILMVTFGILLVSLSSAATYTTTTNYSSASGSSALLTGNYGIRIYVNETFKLTAVGDAYPESSTAYLLNDSGTTISSAVSTTGRFIFNDVLYAGNYYRIEASINGNYPFSTQTYPKQFNTFTIINSSANGANLASNQIIKLVNISYELESGTGNNTLYKCFQNDTNKFLTVYFRNETNTREYVSSSFMSNFNYTLNGNTTRLNYIYNTPYETLKLFFCSNTANNISTITSGNYYNAYSQSRTYYDSFNLNSTTINKTLWLLPNSLGIYTRYNTLTGGGAPLSGVTSQVYRTIDSVTYLISGGLSDSSGLFAVFLDPTQSYSYLFTKTGYDDNSFSLTPNSVDTYSVYMSQLGAGSVYLQNGSSIGTNLSFIITPNNGTLQNRTFYQFGFNVTGLNLTSISMNITNSSGYQYGFNSSSGTFISKNISTGNNQTFIVSYRIQTSSESISFSRIYLIDNYKFVGRYSLFTVMSSWDLYDFPYQYYKIAIILVVLILVIGGLSKAEVIDTNESKIGTGIFIVWAFSIVGWLTIDLAVINPSNPFYILNQGANQFGIAILATIGGLYALKEYLS